MSTLLDDKDKKLQEKLRFAGEKVPSMKRRSNINDYHGRHIYMVTMAVEGRRLRNPPHTRSLSGGYSKPQ